MMYQKYQTEQQELTEKIERLSAELESEKQTTVDKVETTQSQNGNSTMAGYVGTYKAIYKWSANAASSLSKVVISK